MSAIFNFQVITQVGHAKQGQIWVDITPHDDVANGWYKFGLVSPIGAVIKSTSPTFSSDYASTKDVAVTTNAVTSFQLGSIPLATDGTYMNGIYTFSVQYKQILASGSNENEYTPVTKTYTFCTTINKGILSHSFDSVSNLLTVTDLTDYTGYTISTHTITSTPIGGGSASTTVNYSQQLALKAWQSVLDTKATKTGSSLPMLFASITFTDIVSITSTINPPTDYSSYVAVLNQATAKIDSFNTKQCKNLILSPTDKSDFEYILSKLALINAYSAIGDNTQFNKQLIELGKYLNVSY